MQRISSNMTNSDVQYNLRLKESQLNRVNNQLSSQQKILRLRDDPLAAGHLVRYQSYNSRLETFENNVKTLTDQYSISEGYVNQSLQIMQRVRELAVAGAHGTYTPEDLRNMSTEVDQLLQELVLNANATGPDGISLFAGTRSTTTAFETVLSGNASEGEALISQVKYNGTIAGSQVEVDERQYMDVNRAGNQIFWAEKQALFASRDATSYQVTKDSAISIDGQQIKLNAGDNVYSIISKINDSGAAVKASLDPVTNGLNLITTDSRQLWMQDLDGGSTLNDLGLIKDSAQRPPNNIHETARVSGGSLFDTVIALRDAMMSGDNESIGGRVLGSIDEGISNLTNRLAETGAKYERAQENLARTGSQLTKTANLIAREGDLDFTKAVTDLKMLEYVHQAALSTAGKMYSHSLLNYIK